MSPFFVILIFLHFENILLSSTPTCEDIELALRKKSHELEDIDPIQADEIIFMHLMYFIKRICLELVGHKTVNLSKTHSFKGLIFLWIKSERHKT